MGGLLLTEPSGRHAKVTAGGEIRFMPRRAGGWACGADQAIKTTCCGLKEPVNAAIDDDFDSGDLVTAPRTRVQALSNACFRFWASIIIDLVSFLAHTHTLTRGTTRIIYNYRYMGLVSGSLIKYFALYSFRSIIGWECWRNTGTVLF